MENELKVLFYLKGNEANSEGLCPVTGRIRVGKTETCFGARLMARPSLWNTKSGRLTGKGGHAGEVNAALNKISVSVIVCHKEILSRKGSVIAEPVKNAFQGMACSQETLSSYFAGFNADFKNRVGIDREEGTMRGYRSTLRTITRFIKEKYRLNDLPFSGLTFSFIEDFDHWMRITKKFKPNTIVNKTTRLNYVLKNAVSRGHLVRNPMAGYEPVRERATQKYLTGEELRKIMTTPLDKPYLYLTRDMFLFSCFTGLAWVDMHRLTEENQFTAGDRVVWIKAYRKKTGIRCNVPLLEIPIQILEKY